ncbi:uncharacterized protein LOC107430544 [Ziziphus jujuba]|uniref:Uncharacterized protein LOC107430544 n=3 Tax=Ziziphus jujuba TaxID=326968 RepID=A0A6P4BD05_ZIZJJ|nr:uncharacterized protein LOC107430544 [Ziziphus jujuba]XP_015896873.3 uncharacterized protein LOC107430544 [Ziziphus jujuba]
MSTGQSNPQGLVICVNDSIHSFLNSASRDPQLPQELKQIASELSSKPNVPYKFLRAIWFASNVSARPKLIQLLAGSDFVLPSPKPREKSEELKARLSKLVDMVERREYQELVKDITPKKNDSEPFSTYREQLGLGLQVALAMFTGYLAGYYAFRALFGPNVALNAAGGILGLIGGLLVESLLFIIRASSQDFRSTKPIAKQKKKDQ